MAVASRSDRERRITSPRTSAPLRVRLRPDLVFSRIADANGVHWHVKDPLALTFYQFDEREFGLLRMLDGESTIDELLERYRREFAPLYLSARQLLFFVADAKKKGLLQLDAASAGKDSNDDEQKLAQRARTWLGRLNILSVKLPGIDPDSFLGGVYPFIRWMFSRTAAVLGGLLIVSALLLVTMRFDEFVRRLPDQSRIFTPQMLIWIAVAIGVTKILHELGHAFACKHFGGECHELGIMLLVFVPCLYCNVSDSWLLSRRRERMIITAAGMWVELILAALATFGWWFAVDGPVRMAFLSIMIVGSLSTLLLNGNPLMRYDGYFLLSDLLNIPNLATESSAVCVDSGENTSWGSLTMLQSVPRKRRRRSSSTESQALPTGCLSSGRFCSWCTRLREAIGCRSSPGASLP